MGRTQCEKRENIELDKKTEETSYKIQPECRVSAGLRSKRLLGQHASFIRLRRQEKDFN